MEKKKSTKKPTLAAGHGGIEPKDIKQTLIRFKNPDPLNAAREAALMEDVSLNKFMVRAVVEKTAATHAKHKQKTASVAR